MDERKDRKTRKCKSDEKVVGFTSTSIFPVRKREGVTSGETTGIDHPMWRITQGTSILKG